MIRPSQILPSPVAGRLNDLVALSAGSPPRWLRRSVNATEPLAGKGLADVAQIAGAAICALDARIGRQECWAGAWRRRLALSAAALTVQRAGRREDEAALRDALLLTRPGDDVGPAGHILLVWRQLGAEAPPELLSAAGVKAVLQAFEQRPEDEAARAVAAELDRLAHNCGATEQLAGAFHLAQRFDLDLSAGAWFADVLLARRLHWPHPVPLLGTERALGRDLARQSRFVDEGGLAGEAEAALPTTLLAAQARAALRAIDLFAETGRRADRLLAVLPKLRTRAAGRVVERLLSEDAVTASQAIPGMSDRGLRRLFERLVDLGAVRELSGRSSFRIYGL